MHERNILVAPYSREEVKKVMFNIGDLKATGPDGLHDVFYERFWHIIGEELTYEVLLAVNNRKVPVRGMEQRNNSVDTEGGKSRIYYSVSAY
jgi:hypothetical protein